MLPSTLDFVPSTLDPRPKPGLVQTSEYLDMLFDLGLMPVITKPTRVTDHISSLIDHIYTNAPERL